MEKKVKIRLNSTEKVEELLQEIYDQACRQLVGVQNEINKLISSTNLADASIDSKAKYAKAMHDYHGDLNRALSTKVGNTLLGDDDIDIVLGVVVMAYHRHDRADGTVLSH